MDVGGAKGGLRSEINVTPLCDVMLVLLIIMMLIAPMLQKGVDVRLPEAGNTVDKPDTQEQTVIAVTADKRLYINSVPVANNEFLNKLQSTLEGKREKLVVIKGDTDAPYSAIMQAMDDLRTAGIEDIGLITERKLHAAEGGQ